VDTSEPMVIGIPQDMRRTAAFSVAGHVLVLVLLTAVPFVKLPARDVGSYQVVLISPAPNARRVAPSPPKLQAPVPPNPTIPAPPVERAPARVTPAPAPVTPASAPLTPKLVPVPVAPKAERLSDLLHQNMREIAVPKEVTPAPVQLPTEPRITAPTKSEPTHRLTPLDEFHRPDLPVDTSPPRLSSIQSPRQEAPAKPAVDKNLMDALRKFEDTLNMPSLQAPPAAPSAVLPSKPSRTAEEVSAQLKQMPAQNPLKPMAPPAREAERSPPQIAAPSLRDEVTRMLARSATPLPESPSPKREPPQLRQEASLADTGATRAATLERCPPRAKQYCPLLEAAINQLWNADHNTSVRRVLESAGDSATLILIEIRPDGVIQNITVQESSGNKAYDVAIQSLLRDKKQFPPLTEGLKSENFKAITSFKYTRKT
jgi:outer membrane biosynthesis protein TonB